MRIALAAIIILCGANLLIELLDSSLVDVIQERNETIQRQIDSMWQSGNCTQNRVNPFTDRPWSTRIDSRQTKVTNRMTFVQGLIASGYVFDSENFDDCYVKTDSEGVLHMYQEGEDDNEWNYVKMDDDFNVITEKTFTLDWF